MDRFLNLMNTCHNVNTQAELQLQRSLTHRRSAIFLCWECDVWCKDAAYNGCRVVPRQDIIVHLLGSTARLRGWDKRLRGHGCRNGPSSRRRRPLFAGPPCVCWQLRRSAWRRARRRRARRRRARRRWLDSGGEGARELAGQLGGQPRNLACPSQGRTHVSAPHADSKSGREAELSDRVGGHGCCGRSHGREQPGIVFRQWPGRGRALQHVDEF